jgi:hypothetical protein
VDREHRSHHLGRTFRQIIDADVRLNELETALAKAGTIAECWDTIYACSKGFGFSGVRMCVQETVLERFATPAVAHLWQLRIPLAGSHYINFFRDCESHMDPVILNAFVEAVERGLQACPALRPNWTKAPVPAPAHSSAGSGAIAVPKQAALAC